MFRLDDLPTVVDVLDAPAGFRTLGGHVFTGEEGVLLLLRRWRVTDSLDSITWETGRSGAAISEAVDFPYGSMGVSLVMHLSLTLPLSISICPVARMINMYTDVTEPDLVRSRET